MTSMTPDRYLQIKQVFDAAIQQPPSQREQFVKSQCGTDTELRKEVMSLLEAHETPHSVIDDPGQALGSIRQMSQMMGFFHAPANVLEAAGQMVGKTIGRYTIQSVLAAGGMGVIYEAIQQQTQRIVALKVLRPGVASASSLRRFQYETRILGKLEHPGIAQIYDAGVHYEKSVRDGGEGVPYFAMEFIHDAQWITDFVVKNDLPLKKRLSLFVQVCEAVHHGHQKGIIHRDLKPANVLVDSSANAKVIDFGIALATDSDLTRPTRETDLPQLIGTLQYMSPEQSECNPREIDIRSDIYSLGVLLFEVLCEHLPYDTTDVPPFHVPSLIKANPPTRPSAVNKTLKGDIETIVLKAMEKDRHRRYQSAVELSADINRYLAGEAILARPPSVAYKMARFFERNRWQSIAGLSVTAATLIAAVAIVILSYAISADRANTLAQQNRQIAELSAYGATVNSINAAIGTFDIAAAREWARQIPGARPAFEARYVRNRLDLSLKTLLPSSQKVLTGSLAFSPNGTRLAIAVHYDAGGGSVAIIDALTGRILRRFDQPPESNQVFHAAEFDASGEYLIATSDQSLIIFDWQDASPFEPAARSELSVSRISAMAVDASRTKIATVSAVTGLVRFWNIPELAALQPKPMTLIPWATVRAPARDLIDVEFSPDGKQLAVAGYSERTINLWDVTAIESTKEIAQTHAVLNPEPFTLAVLQSHRSHVKTIAFNADGTRLASTSMDKTTILWNLPASIEQAAAARADAQTFAPVGVRIDQLYGHKEGVTCAAFSPTDSYFVSGSVDRSLRVWNLIDQAPFDKTDLSHHVSPLRRPVAALHGHESPLHRVAFSPDGTFIASMANDGSVKLWLANQSEHDATLKAHDTSVKFASFTPDGRHVITAAGPNDNSLILWDPTDLVPLTRWRCPPNELLQRVFIRSASQDLQVIVLTSCRPLAPNGPLACLNILEIDPDNRFQVVAKHKLDAPDLNGDKPVALSPDGSRLAIARANGTVHTIDLTVNGADDRLLFTPPSYAAVTALAFLDQKGHDLLIATSSQPDSDESPRIGLWRVDAVLGTSVSLEALHDHAIRTIAVSSDGRSLATGARDGTIHLWNLPREPSRTMTLQQTLVGHARQIEAIAFHPHEPRLVSSALDYTIKVWTIPQGIEVGTFRPSQGVPLTLQFDPVGDRMVLASGGVEGSDNIARILETQTTPSQRIRRSRSSTAFDRASNFLDRMITPEAAFNALQGDSCNSIQRALSKDIIQRLGEDPCRGVSLQKRAWEILGEPKASPERIRRALTMALEACRLLPDDAPALTTLGIAQYHNGDFKAAQDVLHRAAAINVVRADMFEPAIRAYSAMSHYQLGNRERADQRLEHLFAWIQEHPRSVDPRATMYTRRAVDLINPNLEMPPPISPQVNRLTAARGSDSRVPEVPEEPGDPPRQ